MEFHTKYWVFRHSVSASEAGNPASWTDLSFLEIGAPETPDRKEHGMFEAHFSFAICGSHESRWAAYAFDDTELDGEDFNETLFPCDDFHPDPIASCRSENHTDADLPIWGPREYFLNVVANRISQAADSWTVLIRVVERSINEYVS